MNILIAGAQLLLYDEGKGFYAETGDLAVQGDTILAVGTVPEGFAADRVIDGTDRLVIPGLINAHTHNYMALFRNVADDVPFQQWLFDGVIPREDRMEPEDAYWGAMLSCMEMLSSGTTCFNDMMMTKNMTARAADESGIRAVIGRGISGRQGEEGLNRRLREAREEMEEWKGHPRISYTIAPHAPYSCSGEALAMCAEEAARLGLRLHIHLSESVKEVEDVKAEHGMTPIAWADSLGLFAVPAIVAHAVQATEEEIRIMAEKKVSVVTNPASNMKLGNGFCPLPEMLEAGVNVAIGTDGPASNNALNLFREMGLAVLIHKGRKQDAVSVSAQDALRMATLNGAAALGMEDRIGRIQAGMKADLAILNLNRPQMRPLRSIVSGLVYAANGSETETVLVDGKIVYDHGHFPGLDEERVYYEVEHRLR